MLNITRKTETAKKKKKNPPKKQKTWPLELSSHYLAKTSYQFFYNLHLTYNFIRNLQLLLNGRGGGGKTDAKKGCKTQSD